MYNVYKITNHDTGRAYIGMTSLPTNKRLVRHLYLLRTGTHPNTHLTEDWALGNTSLTIKKIASYETKAEAKDHETRLIQRQKNPYNVRTGLPGAMKGYTRPVFKNARAYLYSEIAELHSTHSLRELIERYGCGGPMISMIGHGHRFADAPETSFDDVFFDEATKVMVKRPAKSSMKAFYKAGGAQ